MGHLTAPVLALQQAIPNGFPAMALPPCQRLQLALQGLAGTQSITGLADNADVSRKFVSQQCAIAEQALSDAFVPHPAHDQPDRHVGKRQTCCRRPAWRVCRRPVGWASHSTGRALRGRARCTDSMGSIGWE